MIKAVILLKPELRLLAAGALFVSTYASGHARFAKTDFADATRRGTVYVRVDNDGIKTGACGGTPTANQALRTVLTPGQTLEVVFWETIDHTSKYRIGFSADETDNFSVALMDRDQFANDMVHPLDIPTRQDVAGAVANRVTDPRAYKFTITVPNTPCEKCSLQLIQKMYPAANGGGPYATTSYFSCADIRIVAAGGTTPTATKPSKPGGLKVEVGP